MHELAITESLLATASAYAQQNEAKKVVRLNLVIGDLAGIVDDSIQFYWDFISAESICSKATLHIDHEPARFLCNDCQHEFELADDLAPCPHCYSINLKVTAGDEFLLKSIEIEK